MINMMFTVRFDPADEKNIIKIMESQGFHTKAKAVRFALRVCANVVK